MSYDIYLTDPVSGATLELDDPHFMRGGTYQVGGTSECWLNITYNYAPYYYKATEGDSRFQDETGKDRGIRGIYGKTGAASIPMLNDMICRIKEAYTKDGAWTGSWRKKTRYLDEYGKEVEPIEAIAHKIEVTKEEKDVFVSEGPNDDYWEPTAANAIKPLYQLKALAEMRPDGVWDGD